MSILDEFLGHLDERFDVQHQRCPKCKVDLISDQLLFIAVPTRAGQKNIPIKVTSCPECGFIGDVDAQRYKI